MNDEGAEHGRPVEVADRARREQCSGRASHMYEYATNCPEDDRGNVTAHRLGVATALVDGEWVAGDVVVDDGVDSRRRGDARWEARLRRARLRRRASERLRRGELHRVRPRRLRPGGRDDRNARRHIVPPDDSDGAARRVSSRARAGGSGGRRPVARRPATRRPPRRSVPLGDAARGTSVRVAPRSGRVARERPVEQWRR